jgi:hypothetical protein
MRPGKSGKHKGVYILGLTCSRVLKFHKELIRNSRRPGQTVCERRRRIAQQLRAAVLSMCPVFHIEQDQQALWGTLMQMANDWRLAARMFSEDDVPA